MVRIIRRLVFLYRDIKPENFLFDSEGNLIVIDFGSSVILLDKTSVVPSDMMCTDLYTPPEEVKDEENSLAKDVWSLG